MDSIADSMKCSNDCMLSPVLGNMTANDIYDDDRNHSYCYAMGLCTDIQRIPESKYKHAMNLVMSSCMNEPQHVPVGQPTECYLCNVPQGSLLRTRVC